MPTPPRPLAERFREKYVVAPNGCHIWIASTNSKGYGRLRNEHGRIELAHRVAWRLSGRPLTQAENWITNVAKPHFASIRSILKKSRTVGTFFVVTAQRRHDTEISDAAVVTQ